MRSWLMVFLIIFATLMGGCGTMGGHSVEGSNFNADTLHIITILETCVAEERKIKRSEINEMNVYLDKYAKFKSDVKIELVELYNSFLIDARYMHEFDEQEYEQKLGFYKEALADLQAKV